MAFLSLISGLLKPAMDLVDSLHTSKEEKLEAQAKMAIIQGNIFAKAAEYESKLLEAQSKIITAEAQGQGFLQRNWRPVTMLTFLVLVVADGFGWLAHPLAPQAWTLLQIGLGGYVVGRSAEKIIPRAIEVFKK